MCLTNKGYTANKIFAINCYEVFCPNGKLKGVISPDAKTFVAHTPPGWTRPIAMSSHDLEAISGLMNEIQETKD